MNNLYYYFIPVTACFSGGKFVLALNAKSPNARESARLPIYMHVYVRILFIYYFLIEYIQNI